MAIRNRGNFGGAAVKMYFGSTHFANAVDMSINKQLQVVDVDVLGEMDPVEQIVDGRRFRGRFRMLRLSKQSLEAMGVNPPSDADAGAFLAFPRGTITIVKKTDTGEETIWKASELVIESEDWRIVKGQISITEASFRFIRLDDK